MTRPVVDPLVPRLTEVLVAAQRRARKQRPWGIPIPDRFLDEIAVGVAPVLRELVREAVAARLDAPGVHDLDAVIRDVSGWT